MLAAIFIAGASVSYGAAAAAAAGLMRRGPVAADAQTHSPESALIESAATSGERELFCAEQWGSCRCPVGRVRWGTGEQWIEAAPDSNGVVACSIWSLPDVAPGDERKHCRCSVPADEKEFLQEVNPGSFLDGGVVPAPDVSCATIAADAHRNLGRWAERLETAAAPLCEPPAASLAAAPAPTRGAPRLSGSTLSSLLDAWVHPLFRDTYARLVGKDGWIDEAFVNYVGGAGHGDKYAKMTELLVRSVHEFSTKPIIVVDFGMRAPKEWTPERYPRLVLLYARPLPVVARRSFNWNKLRAMLMAKVKTGVEVDSDQFVAPGVDRLFEITRREITEHYPMPILPAHFLDWSPKDGGKNPSRYWSGVCEGAKYERCPGQTQRWGHAHPTWTYWALPFVGRWLGRQFRSEAVPHSMALAGAERPMPELLASEVNEDEDLLNLATWLEGGTKQWCKFDVEDPTEFDSFLRREPGGDIIKDARFYPEGVAHVYYTAHHAVKPGQTEQYLERLGESVKRGLLPLPIRYKGGYYANDRELREAHPELSCLI